MISLSKFRKMKLEGMAEFLSYRCSSIYKQIMVTCISYQGWELIHIKRSKRCDTFFVEKTTTHNWISKSQLLGKQQKIYFSGFQHYLPYIINEQVCNYPWPL